MSDDFDIAPYEAMLKRMKAIGAGFEASFDRMFERVMESVADLSPAESKARIEAIAIEAAAGGNYELSRRLWNHLKRLDTLVMPVPSLSVVAKRPATEAERLREAATIARQLGNRDEAEILELEADLIGR